MKKTIIIGGNFRGRTTAIAELMLEADIFVGKRKDNYDKEDIDFQQLFHDNTELCKDKKDKLNSLIRNRNKEFDVWGFKYPRIFRYTEYFKWFRNPHIIYIFRDPYAVAVSQYRREGFNIESIIERTIGYNKAIFESYKKCRKKNIPVLLLSSEKLVLNPKEYVTKIFEFIDYKVNIDQLTKVITKQSI